MDRELYKKGVYTITNIITNKLYIGSTTVSFTRRWSQHKRLLKLNIHTNKYLQNSWNKYGETNFKFEILEECNEEFCLSTEQYWLNVLNTCNKIYGYNISPTVGKTTGTRLSQKHKDSIGNFHRGLKRSEDTRIKMSNNKKEFYKNNPNRHKELAILSEKKVIKLDLNNNFIKEYNSLKSAAIDNNTKPSYISAVCNNIQLTTGGYKYILKEKYNGKIF